jgi:hypothetical protein
MRDYFRFILLLPSCTVALIILFYIILQPFFGGGWDNLDAFFLSIVISIPLGLLLTGYILHLLINIPKK